MAVPGRSGTEMLLERASEVGVIADAVAGAVEGEGRLVIVEGPAGIGKSALLQSAGDAAESAGMQLLTACGDALEHEFGFGVVRHLLEGVAHGRDDQSAPELFAGPARLAAPLLGVAAGPGPTVGPGEAGFAVVHGLYWLVSNLTERAPVALCVDDAHWADAASLRFLAYLARRIEGLPVLLAVGARTPSERAEGPLSALTAAPGAAVVRPAPLSDEAGSRLMHSLAPAASDEICRAAQTSAAGNPFYLHELALAVRDGRDGAAGPGVLAKTPDRVARIVGARLETLPVSEADLARAAAVLGTGALLRHAAALAGLGDGVAGGAADSLRAAGILGPERSLGFVHPILRAAVYDAMPIGARAAAHDRAARLLAAEGAPTERVAAHVMESEPAGDLWACERLEAAATEALGRGAPEAARSYLRRAMGEPPPPHARARLLLELGTAEAMALEPGPAAEHLSLALAAAPGREERLTVALVLASALTHDGRGPEGVEALTRVLDEWTEDPEMTARLEAYIANHARTQLSARAATRSITARLARRDGDGDGERDGTVLAAMAAELAMAGVSASRVAQLSLRSLERLGEPRQPIDQYTFSTAVRSLLVADELDAAVGALDVALEAARNRGMALEFGMLALFRAEAAYRRGDVFDSEADARAAYALASPSSWAMGLPAIAAHLVLALVERGELGEAVAVLEDAGLAAPAATLADYYTANMLLHARGQLQMARGELEDALDDLRECGRRQLAFGEPNPSLNPWRSTLALALMRSGSTEEAAPLVEEELSLARRFGAPRAIGIALRAAGLIHAGADGLERMREAVEVLAPSVARLEHARALADLGAMLRREGRLDEARMTLSKALELAKLCGAAALEETVLERLRAAGARPRRALLSGPGALTPSERRVAAIAAQGLSNREIAASLFVTVRTIEFHLSGAYRKLDIDSRRELARALASEATPRRADNVPVATEP